MIIGVDVGITGALALYNPVRMEVEVVDMPTLWITLAKKTKSGKHIRRRKIDYNHLNNIINAWKLRGASYVWIEKVNAMPQDGVVGSFTFGESVGAVKGVVVANNLKYSEVTPQKWKKRFNLIGKPKEEAIVVAGNLFRDDLFSLKRDHGKADACLIAAYGANEMS